MPPRNEGTDLYDVQDDLDKVVAPDAGFVPADAKQMPLKIRWRNVVLFVILHISALYGMCLIPFAKPYTWLFTAVMYELNALGITAGAHRLWTHRSYQAKLPLRIFLAICNSIAFQNDIIEWSRDHRVHHKYSETDADPHNAKRGFIFAHIGWLCVRKHPDVKEKGKKLDISDLLNDPVCAIQRKVYLPSVLLLCFILPTVIPWYFWGESLWISYYVCAVFRYTLALNFTWLVNSAAHLWGNKPYDKFINPSENLLVALGAMGEGFHNYHHTFPSDYSTSEFGFRCNFTTMFIDAMAFIGLADKRKKMSRETVDRRRDRTGDGSVGFGYTSATHRKATPTADSHMGEESIVEH